ncbi:DUF3304 domain-containing protein [Duganella sp. FT109W]|uniref:DUF3304 domain-containing protein n=1 Tax=Duganella margarita TaxID=2692170 RepID=A0ABW9WJD6_9BURK|nr:DUF3304 domain-containing protein [Duganella margarita]MYN41257.1 DUF3304 domain-containing protein [Duganella margarita]
MKPNFHPFFTIFLSLMVGCQSPNIQAQTDDQAMARIGILNHTGNYIYSASIDGAGGAGMARWGAGGPDVCCAYIPRAWHPGIKVLVRWDMPVEIEHIVKEKVVEIEEYDRPGDVYLNFFPNDEVRVVVSVNGPRNPDFPIRHAGKPKDSISSK